MNEVFLERYRVADSQTIALYKHEVHFKPPSGSYSRVPKPTQTHERKQPAFMQIPHAFHIIPLCRALAHLHGGKKRAAPVLSLRHTWKILLIVSVLETRGPSVSRGHAQKSDFSSLGIICASFPPIIWQPRRVEVNKDIFKSFDTGEVFICGSSRWAATGPLPLHRGSGTDSSDGKSRNWTCP